MERRRPGRDPRLQPARPQHLSGPTATAGSPTEGDGPPRLRSEPVHPADLIEQTIEQTGSIACVGLDPRPALLPPEVRAAHAGGKCSRSQAVARAFTQFNLGILDAVAGRCAAVKPQVACYEAYGSAGWDALEATVAHARTLGIPIILDAKRGDIGSTAAHYGQMAFGGAPGLDDEPIPGIGAEWMTANGYLGLDGIDPMLVDDHHGLFVLVKTSNPSSGDLQDRQLAKDADAVTGQTVADQTAELVDRWGSARLGERGLSSVGAVVGATYPETPGPCGNGCRTPSSSCRATAPRVVEPTMPWPGCGTTGAVSSSRPAEASSGRGPTPTPGSPGSRASVMPSMR